MEVLVIWGSWLNIGGAKVCVGNNVSDPVMCVGCTRGPDGCDVAREAVKMTNFVSCICITTHTFYDIWLWQGMRLHYTEVTQLKTVDERDERGFCGRFIFVVQYP